MCAYFLSSEALSIKGGGASKRGRVEPDRVPLNEVAEKDDDLPAVKTCFRLDLDLNETLDGMTYDQLHEYKGRIENARATDQVATITLDYVPEYLAVEDSVGTY